MRILVWNVRGFRAGVERVAEAAAGLEPDVALITECSTARRIGRFADTLDMTAHHGPLPPLLRRARNAVLVREPLRVDDFDAHLFRTAARWHPRGVVIAGLKDALTVAVTHLGLSGKERKRHTTELFALLGEEGPVVLGGDLNELPGRGAARMLSERFEDVWKGDGGETYPAREPSARIDYLFTRGVRVMGASVPDSADVVSASDHLPLFAELELPG